MVELKYEILIVDDSKLFLQTIENTIKSELDCKIYKALEYKEAIRLLDNHDIDLILLDINLPGKDGFEIAKLIKNNHKTSNIPIIFITGNDPYQELKEKGFNLGAVDYLIKPFKDNELLRLLKLYFRFIQHEKETNQKLYSLTKELSEEVERRKRIEQTLRKTEKELRKSIASKDRFFSIIAHDLKNPLGAFKDLTKLIIEEYNSISPDEFFTLIKELNQSAQTVYELLQNLLEWSRTQLGQIKINQIEFDISYIINQTFDLLKLTAKKKNIKLISKVNSPVLVYADVNMITTVLRNLISNSIKFTENGGTISINENKSNVPNFVSISVKDTGIGMDKSQLENLFNIESIISTVGTNKEKGTGLGLIICKDFVEMNSGKLSVKSKKGEGSEFIIELPKKLD